MKRLLVVSLAMLAIATHATQLVTSFAQGIDPNPPWKVWTAYQSLIRSDSFKCQPIIRTEFYRVFKEFKDVGYVGDLGNKLLVATKEALIADKADTKHKCIVVALEYKDIYYVFVDLSLDDLHFSFQWREIVVSMYLAPTYMFGFNKNFELVARISG